MIGSNATEGEVGFSGYATRAATQDYCLNGYGVAVGLHDRVELSLARQDFDASPAIALNGIATREIGCVLTPSLKSQCHILDVVIG